MCQPAKVIVPRLELLNYGSLPTVRASLPHVVNDRFEAVIRIPPTPGLGRSATVAAGKASLSSPCLRRPANWKLPTKGADHGDQHCNHHSPAVEQGKASRPLPAGGVHEMTASQRTFANNRARRYHEQYAALTAGLGAGRRAPGSPYAACAGSILAF
jgi:hypothetical protein